MSLNSMKDKTTKAILHIGIESLTEWTRGSRGKPDSY